MDRPAPGKTTQQQNQQNQDRFQVAGVKGPRAVEWAAGRWDDEPVQATADACTAIAVWSLLMEHGLNDLER